MWIKVMNSTDTLSSFCREKLTNLYNDSQIRTSLVVCHLQKLKKGPTRKPKLQSRNCSVDYVTVLAEIIETKPGISSSLYCKDTGGSQKLWKS